MGLAREHELLLRRILGVIGAASLTGCATRTIADEAASDGSDSSSSEDAQTEVGESSEAEAEAGSESDSGEDPVKFDLPDDSTTGDPTTGDPTTGDPPDTDGGELCGPFADDWTLDAQWPDSCGTPPDWGSDPVCFFPPEGVSCEDEPQSYACIIEAYNCGLVDGGESIWCGPYTTPEGACCYVVTGECAVGRPFCVAGRARVAALVDGHGWAEAPRPRVAKLDDSTRAALADAWRRHGRSEHASIASFARFTSQLLALGAPAKLIAASLEAGADERRHALRCFGLANAYASATKRPAALEIEAAIESRDPLAIAVSLAREGCVAETVSLMLLTAAHAQAEDRAVRACLAEMIADERRHVLLAWEALAWLCRRFGAKLQAAIARVFGEAERHVGFGATTPLCADGPSMRAHGYLDLEARREVAVEALRVLVLPSARALLGYSTITPQLSV